MTKTMSLLLKVATLAIGALAGALALGAEVNVTLSGANEVPPVKTMASGRGQISVADDGSVSGSITTNGLTGTMAHIHMAAAGSNGPPIVGLTKEGDTYSVPAGSKLNESQMKAFKAGELYVNVHSAAHAGGEIRGQLAK